jgi:tetratricopeptide (TPR) repeat protein
LPNEVYPQTQIQEINRILKEIAANDAAYEQAISEADNFYKLKDWQLALTKYELASSLKTNEQYPKDKIAELNGILGDLAAQQAKYDALIEEADQFFNAENYTSSIASYQAALVIKANESYPQSQITKIEGILAQIAETQRQYDDLIKEGDKQFLKNEWALALPQYEQALELKAEEIYPQEQIIIINQKLQAIANQKSQYEAIIAEADQQYQSAQYEAALTKYEAALSIFPEEQYPKDQMKNIRDLLEDLAQKNAEYEKIIAKADDLLLQESFEKSKEQYQKALEIFNVRPYPQEQILKIDVLIEKHKQFQALVEAGDEQFKNKEYEAALSSFNNASALLPEKTYPPQKIAEIEQIMELMAMTRAAYDAAITKADAHFAAGEFDMAKQSYQQALDQISTEVYPRQKMMEIDQILADLARKRVQFDKIMAQAKKAFEDQSYDMALGKYKEALAILPEETLPQQKIDEINEILAQMANQQERYESLVTQGDQAFAEKEYKSSIQMFQQAAAIYPNETYPPQKIAEAEAALAKIQRELDVAYQKAIDEGDRSFRKKDWDPAKTAYQQASEIKPEELYPKEKLAEINKKLEEELMAQQKEYDRYIADGERFYSTKYYQEAILAFEKALTVFPFEKYPSEMIDKIFELIKKTSMLTLLDGKITLVQNQEEKFKFDPIAFKDRSENYILLEVKRLNPETQVKLFVNFGKGGSQNGGYSIPLKSKDGYHSYFVSIGKQVRWVNQDNDYISIMPEGGDVEVKLIKLSRNGI